MEMVMQLRAAVSGDGTWGGIWVRQSGAAVGVGVGMVLEVFRAWVEPRLKRNTKTYVKSPIKDNRTLTLWYFL